MTQRQPRLDLDLDLDPLAPEPHDWTRFKQLEQLFSGAETHTDPQKQETFVREARSAFEARQRMVVRMVRFGHTVEAWTPDEFVDFWRKGYR